MDIMRYDFVAPAGKHFGVMKTLDQTIAEIPSPLDVWKPTAGLTLSAGRVASWDGSGGRRLVQAASARQPILDGTDLLFGDGAGGQKASMGIEGTQIGLVGDLTIAGRFRLPTVATTVDSHYFWGQQGTQTFRATYRYTSGNNFIRIDYAAASVLDIDLPAGIEDIPLIVTITGGTALKAVVGATTGTGTLPTTLTLDAFTLGAAVTALGDWPGWIGKFGIWRHAATATQIDALKAWLVA